MSLRGVAESKTKLIQKRNFNAFALPVDIANFYEKLYNFYWELCIWEKRIWLKRP